MDPQLNHSIESPWDHGLFPPQISQIIDDVIQVDLLTIISLLVILVGTASYFSKWQYWDMNQDPYQGASANSSNQRTRDIVERMNEAGKNCAVFYGSQSGTAEDYASRLAQEGKRRYGLETMVADLEDYDYDNLDTVPDDKVLIFVLATYGEGEPTDNAVDFYEFVKQGAFSESRVLPLGNLKYVIFGLGNSKYEHYNHMCRSVNKTLENLGAHRIGDAGEGNDGTGTLEEDFLAWKDGMWAALSNSMGLKQREEVYEPVFNITKQLNLTGDSPGVYTGQRDQTMGGPSNAQHPYMAAIVESRELFTAEERNCVHMAVDISGSGLSYQTGDHIAVWPTNPEHEVTEFLRILGLAEDRHTVVDIEAIEPTAKVPFPTPTTFETIVRSQLEICAPVSRQFLATLAPFAPNEAARTQIARLGEDKDYFHKTIGQMHYNIARILRIASGGERWVKVPFSAFIEGLPKLQPRYYSISSSSLAQPDKVSITAVVESQVINGRDDPFKGVATNFLLSLKQKQNGEANTGPRYLILGGEGKEIRMPIHIRASNFRLPRDPSKPVILIGPGTGVAPMRGFVQERAKMAQSGQDVGRTLMFFGCRRRDEDYLYASEWEVSKSLQLSLLVLTSTRITERPWGVDSNSSPHSLEKVPRRSTFNTGSRNMLRKSTIC